MAVYVFAFKLCLIKPPELKCRTLKGTFDIYDCSLLLLLFIYFKLQREKFQRTLQFYLGAAVLYLSALPIVS